MFNEIVIPVDGSEHAEKAAARGFEIASQQNANVHLICVADTGPLSGYQLPGERESAEDAITRQAASIISAVEEKAPSDVTVTTATPIGSAKSQIIKYADEVGADLIVMGSRGRDGVERLMLGSVTEHIVRVSDIDVLVHGGRD